MSASLDSSGRPVIVIACHAWFHEQVGGSFKIATELAEDLAERGCRVAYVCGTREASPANPTLAGKVELWRYPYPKARSPHPTNLILHVWRTRQILLKLTRGQQIVCLNGHSPLQFLGASLGARTRCRRQVYSVHSPFADELHSHWNGRDLGIGRRAACRVANAVERMNCRRADIVQCDSQFTASTLEHSCRAARGKIRVAPLWVDLDRFRPATDVAAARNTLGEAWHAACPIFFTIRRLEPRMGLDSLVDAATILRAQGRSFRVIIGGEGSERESLQRQIMGSGLESHVILAGRISDEELPLCFAAADCCVLPTRALECFGLTVLEALACGTPVIGTPVGAIPEIVGRQGKEWLTAGSSSLAIAERMSAFLRGDLQFQRNLLRELAGHWRSEVGLERVSRILFGESR